MKKQDEIASATSCLNRADDDEPIFVLRAHDPCAPAIVRAWADRYEWHKRDYNTDGQLTHPQVQKLAEARALALEMERWQKAKRTPK